MHRFQGVKIPVGFHPTAAPTAERSLRFCRHPPRTARTPPTAEKRLENLLGNVIRHGGDAVDIRVGMFDTETGFYVADDGPGIPETDREAVFEHGESSQENGMGFGLSIVRTIANAHGWSIRATESKAGGARFEVTGLTGLTETSGD
ncbi:sensor histidine kinase [Natronomonas sp.]|uniref:sensor histidine kinase n=1 Tax=Natronomonas sp. TaxID=2184060 RepID=UPI003FA52E5A